MSTPTGRVRIADKGNTVLSIGPRSASPDDTVVISVDQIIYGSGRSILMSRAMVRELDEVLTQWLADGWPGVRQVEGPSTADAIAHFKDIAIRYQIEADRARTDAARQIDAAMALIPVEHRSADLDVIAKEQAGIWQRIQRECDELEQLRRSWIAALSDLAERARRSVEPLPSATLGKWVEKTISAQDRILSSRSGRKPKGEAPESPIYDMKQLSLFDDSTEPGLTS